MLELSLLVSKDAELVSTSFTSFMTTELARVLVITLEFLGADNALNVVRVFLPRRFFQSKDGFSELKANFLLIC